IVEALRKAGHDVTEAADGGRLLMNVVQAFDRNPARSHVDVIVTDVRMPVWNGLELLERLAETDWRVPVILMTAFGDEDIRRRAARLGAVLFEKPLSVEALREAVERLGGRAT
ncbi:MAG TPA: response regulator, partial [Polyangiaceae bacterium]|nr:response regulator [Polyangiaceae bacterium]